ncbi:acetamidase/formamidase family protein [bacterium]|nr:acetamidase/formamidase family protein [bacterium]
MDRVDITDEHFVCTLAADSAPCRTVLPGDVLRVRCRSALDRDVGPGPVRAAQPNPATGPIAVEGAAPGQALRIEIIEIHCDAVGHVSGSPAGEPRPIPIEAGCAVFAPGICIHVAPMIGVIGVAPAEGSWSAMDCGPWGGNLDTNDVAPGATVFLPVLQPGGLLVLGDVHAVMGDGEIGGQGLEVAADVVLRVGVEPDPPSDAIVIVRNGEVMTVGAGDTLDAACRDAAAAMARLIAGTGRMGEFDAMKFLGLAGQLRVGQQCCATRSARVAVPLDLLPSLAERLRGGRGCLADD